MVAVGVGASRVRVGAVLAVVGEPVAVGVAGGVIRADVEVMALLPAVGEAVVVALGQRMCGGERRDGDPEQEGAEYARRAGDVSDIGRPSRQLHTARLWPDEKRGGLPRPPPSLPSVGVQVRRR
jgi:hypothetical protein